MPPQDWIDVLKALGPVFGAMAVIVGALINFFATRKVDRNVKGIKDEVTTINGKTIAQLLDAIETRRITKLPRSSRTGGEKEHLDVVDLDSTRKEPGEGEG